jgi:hypothetical protein
MPKTGLALSPGKVAQLQAREDREELETIAWLLENGCPPSCNGCRHGLHDTDHGKCSCCGLNVDEDYDAQ